MSPDRPSRIFHNYSNLQSPPQVRSLSVSNHLHFEFRKYLIASALGLATVGSLAMGLAMTSTPAHAQPTVFDQINYSNNILQAARTHTPLTNQNQHLPNQAQ